MRNLLCTNLERKQYLGIKILTQALFMAISKFAFSNRDSFTYFKLSLNFVHNSL